MKQKDIFTGRVIENETFHRNYQVYLNSNESRCSICDGKKKLVVRDGNIKLKEIFKAKHCQSKICRLLYRASKNEKFGYKKEELRNLKMILEKSNLFPIFHYVNAHIVNLHSRVKMQPRKSGRLSCDLTTKEAFEIFPKDMICPVFDIKMSWGNNIKNSPSLDRIDNTKGYHIDNVHWISYHANQIKSKYNYKELQLVSSYMRKKILFPNGQKGCFNEEQNRIIKKMFSGIKLSTQYGL